MDQVIQAVTDGLWALAAAAITAAAGYAIPAIRAWAVNQVQKRIGEGAARVAGEIALEVATNPTVSAVTELMVADGIKKLRERFPDTAAKLPWDTLAGMVRGELGKLGPGGAR